VNGQSSQVLLLTLLLIWLATLLLAGIAQAQPVTITIYHLEQFGNDLDVQSYGDFYASAIIDGTTVDNESQHLEFIEDPFVVPLYPSGELLTAPWVLTRDVSSLAGAAQVHLRIWDDDLFSSDDQADINPNTVKNGVDLVVDLTTGTWSGDVNWPQNCVGGPNNPNSKSATICFDISVWSQTGDADNDGLLDSWEHLGFDADNDGAIDINLPALGANPLRKDVFVEMDCLVAGNHSHCPRQDAITDIVQSFANAPVDNPDGTFGIQLHVDTGTLFGVGIVSIAGTGGVNGAYGNLGGGGNQIPEAGNDIILAFDAPQNTTGTNFFTLKQNFFDSRRNLIFRYGIFGHQISPPFRCTSGQAPIPGRNLIVTLGGVRGAAGGACFATDAGGFSVGSRNQQAGTFMHEFGHTLGLTHDGDQPNFNNKDVNFKPNYISLMNYTFQFCTIPPSTLRPDLLAGGCDYSRLELKTLKETSLDECEGVDDGGFLGLGTMNWNGNSVSGEGVTCLPPNTNNVQADINRDGVCVGPGNDGMLTSTGIGDDFIADNTIFDGPNRVCSSTAAANDTQTTGVGQTPDQVLELSGYNDWNNLRYNLVAIGLAGSGATTIITEPSVETIERAQQYMSEMLAPNVTIDKTGPATGKPGDVLAYTVEIRNQGNGPAVSATLTDTAPDGSVQTSSLKVIKVGDVITQTTSFTVPANACPGDFTSAGISVAFKDFVGKEISLTDSVQLQIVDVIPPTLNVSLSPSSLWPPNHSMQAVTATIQVSDNCDPNAAITLVSVTSNEPEAGYIGAGDIGPDVQDANIGADDRSFSLRAEGARAVQSTGRVYTIVYRATDASGNLSEATAAVTVPKHQ
jgi:uncharacterized repeat protein (TIGR01451 family)